MKRVYSFVVEHLKEPADYFLFNVNRLLWEITITYYLTVFDSIFKLFQIIIIIIWIALYMENTEEHSNSKQSSKRNHFNQSRSYLKASSNVIQSIVNNS